MIRVYLRDAFPGDLLDISILQVSDQPGDPRYILHQHTEGEGEQQFLRHEWERVEDIYGVTTPTLRLPTDAAHALLGALTTHFQGGVDDLAMLRKDYTAERARVDKLLDAVIDIATAEPATTTELRPSPIGR